jgi:glycerophosphoryl diester phosphodiesterase
VTHPLDWLTANPIAHRGLHDAGCGLIENTAGAVRAAIAAGYGIEVDVQISADGEAMVHHDDVLGRLTEGEGRLDGRSAAALQCIAFRGSDERMLTLGELCDLVAGRATMLVELKSRFDDDGRLAARVATVLAGYRGPVAPMSFDPRPILKLRHQAPHLTLGMVAAKERAQPHLKAMPARLLQGMGYLVTAAAARPQFLAYGVADLPAFAPLFARRVLRMPLLTWTVRTEADRRRAQRWADQMIFEGFRP